MSKTTNGRSGGNKNKKESMVDDDVSFVFVIFEKKKSPPIVRSFDALLRFSVDIYAILSTRGQS